MKPNFLTTIQTLTVAFLMFAITVAHAASPSNDTIYTVQLGTFENMSIVDFEEVLDLGYVYAEKLAQGEQMSVFLSNYKSKTAAENALTFAKGKSYPDAFISERPLVRGEIVFVVQIASHHSTDFIDWDKYARGGQMYVITENDKLKVTSIAFKAKEKAGEKARILQQMGFEGAFVRKINTLQMHKVTQFNTVRELNFMPAAVSADRDKNTEGITVVEEDAIVDVDIPTTYNYPTTEILTDKGPSQISTEVRASVKSLQQFLKENEAYDSSIDGVYGKGTQKGVTALETNKQYAKYVAMSGENTKGSSESLTKLESIISNINDNPKESYAALADENSPLAKAYRAYILYIADQVENQAKINDLMNAAIIEAYKDFEGDAPFDYTSTYSYTDLEQLILHTRYVQAALKNEPITPCWLFIKHKEEAYRAFRKATEKGMGDANFQGCHGFMEWDNIILLKTISTDLNPDEDNFSAKQLKMERQHTSKRNRLYMIPRALGAEGDKEVKSWNNKLWANLDLKIKEDKFFAKYGVPFKLAYHKAWIQLEDHFIEKGFTKEESNTLALSVVQSIVGVDVESYLE